MNTIHKKDIEKFLSSHYSKEEIDDMLSNSTIKQVDITLCTITYDNGVEDIIYKNDKGKIIHLNPLQ